MSALAFLVVAVISVACGATSGGLPLTSSSYSIYEAVTGQRPSIAVIDTRSRTVARTLPFGTLTPDLHHLYAVVGDQLSDVDPRTGSTIRSMQMPRAYDLPPTSNNGVLGGLSQNGHWLALQSWDQPSNVPSSSHFLVVGTTFDSTRQIDLNGWFDFDAISNDGQRLYLIEYLTGGVYRVRIYNVAPRALDPTIVVDKTNPDEVMTGVRVMSVPSPDGHWLYSIYARQNGSPFIHALNLDAPFALCIDLPGPGYGSTLEALGWSLALGGDKLYASNATLGKIDDLDLSQGAPRLLRTASLGTDTATSAGLIQEVEAKEVAGTALLSRDGNELAMGGSHGIALVDTSTFRVRNQALAYLGILGLGLTPDGRILYAAASDRQIVQISMASGTAGQAFNPGAGVPMTILAVSGSAA